LTCISSWYICIPNIIWIHLTITEKMNGNYHYHECDGRTSPYHYKTLFQQAYNSCSAWLICFRPFWNFLSLILRCHHCRWKIINFGLCWWYIANFGLTAYSSENSLTCHTCCTQAFIS
jgi:hypothetical protein